MNQSLDEIDLGSWLESELEVYVFFTLQDHRDWKQTTYLEYAWIGDKA